VKEHRWNLATRSCWDCGVLISQVDADRSIVCVDPHRKVPVVIPAGALFTITAGEYSDFSVDGVFRALKDIDGERLRGEWLAQRPVPDSIDAPRFTAWLALNGFLEQIPAFELHLDGYDGEATVETYSNQLET
jgi:hypothetical protein